ncbi:MAG: phage integrase N-terminal SAM-like domain-containing protein [Candidatus Aenigmarchaeota archaeon]|nr:phage integrase N-terminal SAM-like domain-containing protein [Candidatus Aenigmarchaeota archaeon]
MDEPNKLELELDSGGFSSKTKKSYLFFVKDFLIFVKNKPHDIKEDDIKRYSKRKICFSVEKINIQLNPFKKFLNIR